MSEITVRVTEEQVQWALGAAKQDASYLISPGARQRALSILSEEHNDVSDAARIILHDGGAQQGSMDPNLNVPLMAVWVKAATLLGVFDDETPKHKHEWGPIELSGFTGLPIRRCSGCTLVYHENQ